MRLLLLLSALLAALTGASAQARVPRAELVQVTARAVAVAAEPAHAHVVLAARPAALSPVGVLATTGAPPLLPAPRLWAERRRE